MSDPNQAIKMCKWRKDIGGVSVCTGELAPCGAVIDKGECDTLKKFFGQPTKFDKLKEAMKGVIESES